MVKKKKVQKQGCQFQMPKGEKNSKQTTHPNIIQNLSYLAYYIDLWVQIFKILLF